MSKRADFASVMRVVSALLLAASPSSVLMTLVMVAGSAGGSHSGRHAQSTEAASTLLQALGQIVFVPAALLAFLLFVSVLMLIASLPGLIIAVPLVRLIGDHRPRIYAWAGAFSMLPLLCFFLSVSPRGAPDAEATFMVMTALLAASGALGGLIYWVRMRGWPPINAPAASGAR